MEVCSFTQQRFSLLYFQSLNFLWEDYLEKLVQSVQSPLQSYTSRFPEAKVRWRLKSRSFISSTCFEDQLYCEATRVLCILAEARTLYGYRLIKPKSIVSLRTYTDKKVQNIIILVQCILLTDMFYVLLLTPF